MPLKESEAIVLRSFPLGDGDRLVSFLDREFGRIRGVARGARLPKSRFGSTLELLSYIRIWYFERENRELVRINQCELIESFIDVQTNYQSGVLLALISEVTETILGDREPAEAQFRLLLLTARAFRKYGPSPVVLAYFCLWTVRLGGWLGFLDRCVRCARKIENESLFLSAGFSGLNCINCRSVGMKEISKESLLVGRQALSGTLDRLLSRNPPATASEEISSYALNMIELHIEKKLISRKLLQTGEAG